MISTQTTLPNMEPKPNAEADIDMDYPPFIETSGMKGSISTATLESQSSEGEVPVKHVVWGRPSKNCRSFSHKVNAFDRRITIGTILLLFVLRFRPLWLVLKGTAALDVLVTVSNWIDVSCLCVESLLAVISLYYFFKPSTKTVPPDAEFPTHFICVLIYKESNETVRRLLGSIAKTLAKGRIVLVLGCQKETTDKEGKITIAREFDIFDEVIMSILEKDDTMIRGACSNVFHAQKCVIQYADDYGIDLSNSIFWKFDANCIMEDDIIQEVGKRWVTMPKEERPGAIFVGAVFFQTVLDGKTIFNDNDRSIWNIGFWTWKSLEAYFFRYMATAVVSLSMEGMMHAQLTNPGMVAEDELTPWKIRGTHSRTQMVRLDSRVIKAMPVPSGLKFYYSKALRWDIGGLENVIYMIKWAFGFLEGAENISNSPVAFIHTFRQMFQRFFWTSNIFLLGVFSFFFPSVVNRSWWHHTGLYIGGGAILVSFLVQVFTITTFYNNSKYVKATWKSLFGIAFGLFVVQPFMALFWQTAYYVDVFVKGGFAWPVADSKGKMHENNSVENSPVGNAQIPEMWSSEKTPLLCFDHRLKPSNYV